MTTWVSRWFPASPLGFELFLLLVVAFTKPLTVRLLAGDLRTAQVCLKIGDPAKVATVSPLSSLKRS